MASRGIQIRAAGPRHGREAGGRGGPGRWVRSLLLLSALVLGGCDLGGGGGGGAAGGAVGAAQVLDLPPGQTTAQLAWAPSAGTVSGYMVYESRNGANYAYVATVNTESVTLSGSAGDTVKIAVVAYNPAGQQSPMSAPSPELRFNAAVVNQTSSVTTLAATAPAAAGGALERPASAAAAEADGGASGARSETPGTRAAAEAATPSPDVTTPVGAAADPAWLFLRSEPALASTELSNTAEGWLQRHLDASVAAGVQLVGSGRLDEDGLRDLVWQDASGQLLVSTGSAVADADAATQLPTGFLEGPRLGATERFAALADFDGDARGDWVVEDTVTGEVWILEGDAFDRMRSARGDREPLDWLLVGHGDFDADGRAEFVWQRADGGLEIGHPWATAPGFGDAPLDPTSRLLAIADLDGDGSDDLLALNADARLEWLRVEPGPNGLGLERRLGPALATDGLDPLATLDVDEDGRAELAWVTEAETLEIWDLETGPRSLD